MSAGDIKADPDRHCTGTRTQARRGGSEHALLTRVGNIRVEWLIHVLVACIFRRMHVFIQPFTLC